MKTPGAECVLVGEGTLAVRGAEILLAAGFRICAYVSPDRSLKPLARAGQVPHFTGDAELGAFVQEHPAPYLFSLNNPLVLGAATLAPITTLALNIHDSPLPAYAGLNATSWALLAGEHVHGVTAHRIAAGIDTGEIYGQRNVPIAPDDTACSLNAACFDASESLFETLVHAIGHGSLTPHAMPDAGRTYFGKNARPANSGFLDFGRSATELDRTIRALDFGNVANPLGSAKILWGKRVLIASGSRTEPPRPEERDSPAGTVMRGENTLRIRCGQDILVVRALHELWGEPVSLRTLRVPFLLTGTPRAAWTVLDPRLPTVEARSLLRLGMRRLRYPSMLSAAGTTTLSAQEAAEVSIADVARRLTASSSADEVWVTGVALLTLYLWRLEPGRTFGYVSERSRAALGLNDPLFDSQRPVRIPQPAQRSFAEWRRLLQKELQDSTSPVPRDLLYRGTGQAEALSSAPLVVHDGTSSLPHISRDAQFTFDGELVLRSYRFSAAELRAIAAHIEELARCISTQPELELSEHSLAGLATREGLRGEPLVPRPPMSLDFSHRPPQTPALRNAHQTLSYGELDQRIKNGAAGLVGLGLEPRQRVGLMLACPIDMVVGIFAVLRAGATYVPMDPDLPRSRLEVIAEDSDLALLLQDDPAKGSQQVEPQGPIVGETAVQSLAAVLEAGRVADTQLPDAPLIRGEDDAYVIFTSGTTGRPKGIRVTRSNLEAQISARFQAFGDPAPTRFLCLHSMAFDSSVAGLFWTIASGGELCVLSKEGRRDLRALLAMIENWEASHLDIPPSLYSELLREPHAAEALRSVRVVIVGGEECAVELAARHAVMLPHAQLFNEYGPTETTVFCTLYAVPKRDIPAPVPIGRPIPGVELHLMDRFGAPLPPELPGELCVSGPTVSPGYLGRPKLTAKRFLTLETGRRIYRTGDRAYLDNHRQVRFLGRMDNQVQVNGHRVELGEIEAALLGLPELTEVVVAAKKTAGGTRLFAYYVGSALNHDYLRSELSARLPAYMVPAAFAAIASIPLDAAGKVDRDELPDIVRTGTRYVEPTTDLEREIAHAYSQELQVHAGLEGHFFDLGGSSLEALRVVRVLRERGHRLNVATLYHHPTVSQLAATLLDIDAKRWSTLVPIQPHGQQPTLFAIHILGRANEYYVPLSEQLGDDYPIYGLTAQVKVDAHDQPYDVEELAQIYLEEMKRKQPQGPYHLAAVSIAGAIAYEMAQRLTAGGDTVALLLFFDTKGPIPPEISLLDRGRYHLSLLQELGLSYVGERIGQRLDEARVRWLGRLAKHLRQRDLPIPGPLRLYQVMDDNMKASVAYFPAAYPGRITVFRATKWVFYPMSYVEEGFGWGEVALGGVHVVDIEGEHTGMLAEPAVTGLATRLREVFRELKLSE